MVLLILPLQSQEVVWRGHGMNRQAMFVGFSAFGFTPAPNPMAQRYPADDEACLCSASAAVSGKAELSGKEISLLEKLLQWPAASLFPALDISRLIILDEKMANLLASRAGPLELSPLGAYSTATSLCTMRSDIHTICPASALLKCSSAFISRQTQDIWK